MAKIKICGIKREQDIEVLNELLPDFCGFIIDFPKSHRNLSKNRVRELAQKLDSRVKAVGVFVNPSMESAAELLLDGTLDIVQLHGQEEDAFIAELKARTGKKIIKAFKIRTPKDIERALQSSADYILLDQGYGTGETFDWNLIPQIHRPWMLAGGLTAENLVGAIEKLRPDVVDLSSSVETSQQKDPDKIRQVISIVRNIPML